MRSLQTSGDSKVVLHNIPDYAAAPGEVLVQPIATGICGTDLDIIDGRIDPNFVTYPVTIGHEWCGVVLAHGEGVSEPSIGSRVSIEGIIPCGKCRECVKGATNRCEIYSEIGFTRPGAAADLVTVPARQVHLLNSSVSVESACLIEPELFIALSVMGVVLYFAMGDTSAWLKFGLMKRLIYISGLVTLGGVSYFVTLLLLGFRPSDYMRRVKN